MSYILDKEKSWVDQDFGLDKRLVKALSKLGFTYPTLVQSKSIPLALQGKDLLVRARTGSGKTIAFALPTLHKLLMCKASSETWSNKVFAVILVPTKELCKQIEKNIEDLIYYCRDIVKICSLLDDNPTITQFKLQSKPDIIVSTPAKLVFQLKSGKIDLSQAKMMIMDEADLVLSFGYADDIQTITSKMPKIFQGLLMSATLSPELDKFKRVVLHNPAVLKLEESTAVGNLLQFYLPVSQQDKFLVLYVFLKLGLLQGKGLIFVNDINKCYRLKLFLEQFFIPSAVLNSEMPLNSRIHILDEFNRGVFDYLIATDASIDHGGEDENEGDGDDMEESGAVDQGEGDDESDIDEASTSDDEESEGENSEDEDEVKAKVGSKRKSTDTKAKVRKPTAVPAAAAAKPYSDYGVSRGLDFQGVQFVINFDFPVTSSAYTHRIGRTARGGASGTALSFVSIPDSTTAVSKQKEFFIGERDQRVLQEVRLQQPRLGAVEGDNILAAMGTLDDVTSNNNTGGSVGDSSSNSGLGLKDEMNMQPALLLFNMKEIDSFRYRVDDTLRGVTMVAVRELRAAELKKEILNSEKLKSYFAENPNDFKVLRHDKTHLNPTHLKEHLKFVPEYLIPVSMRSIANSTASQPKKKRKKAGAVGGLSQQQRIDRSKMRDPLRSLGKEEKSQSARVTTTTTSETTSAGASGGEVVYDDAQSSAGGEVVEQHVQEVEVEEERVYTTGEAKSSLGRGISGRKEWKMRHKKGQFNSKIVKKFSNQMPGSFNRKKHKP